MIQDRLHAVRDDRDHCKAGESKYCQHCGAWTREKKPYCSEHVEMHEYVAAVTKRYNQLRDDIAHGRVTDDVVHELWACINGEGGSATLLRIHRLIGIAGKVVLRVARRMGWKVKRNARRGFLVILSVLLLLPAQGCTRVYVVEFIDGQSGPRG